MRLKFPIQSEAEGLVEAEVGGGNLKFKFGRLKLRPENSGNLLGGTKEFGVGI
jgi:hypothetical protein